MAERTSKKQARIDRKLAKKLEKQKRSVRFSERVQQDLNPRLAEVVGTEELPRTGADPQSIMQMRMDYVLHECADREDEWSWGQHRNWCTTARTSGDQCVVKSTMIMMSTLTWAEILDQRTGSKRKRRKKHHDQSWDSICGEAQSRWLKIGREEEELFRFRIGSTQRIWGYRQKSTFYVVWWDPEHKIYPTEKD
ncbi:hypothetical protein [Yoonia algicola]|uniref:Uncharacterized protein n=1 Tax=Yoonia algicola TaxID=3137368 RepID=A0AAN0M6A1_9RHOB